MTRRQDDMLACAIMIALMLLFIYSVMVQSELTDTVLVTGEVKAAEHEAQDGYFTIGQLTVMAPARSPEADLLRSQIGVTVSIVIGPKRKLQAIERE